MALHILRAAFVLLTVSVTLLYLLSFQRTVLMEGTDSGTGPALALLGIALGIALAVMGIDIATKRKRLAALSGVFLGLVAGLVAAFALGKVVDLIGLLLAPGTGKQDFLNLLEGVKVLIGLVTCYLGISLVMQTKDDFRFVIPYVEFAKQVRGSRPTLLDTSVVIDGRILDIVETRVIQGTLIVPKFVLNELQAIADSADKLRRARGRRGLDVLQKLQDDPMVDVHIEEMDVEGSNVDQKLVALGQELKARVMTNDYNLNQVATLRGVDVINLNDLAKSLRPIVLPGEPMTVKINKPGESPSQGVGYLDDGTMVVVEQARQLVGQEVELVVTSMLQTSAGRMIFGRHTGEANADSQEAQALQAASHGIPGSSSDALPESPGSVAASDHPSRHTGSGGVSARNPRRSN